MAEPPSNPIIIKEGITSSTASLINTAVPPATNKIPLKKDYRKKIIELPHSHKEITT